MFSPLALILILNPLLFLICHFQHSNTICDKTAPTAIRNRDPGATDESAEGARRRAETRHLDLDPALPSLHHRSHRLSRLVLPKWRRRGHEETRVNAKCMRWSNFPFSFLLTPQVFCLYCIFSNSFKAFNKWNMCKYALFLFLKRSWSIVSQVKFFCFLFN